MAVRNIFVFDLFQVKKRWIVVGISGITCSGKTTLALKIQDMKYNCIILHQEKYNHPRCHPKHQLANECKEVIMEIESAVNLRQLYLDTIKILKGENVPNSVTSINDSLDQCYILVLDGSFVLNYAPLRDICDLRYHLTLNFNVCESRRKNILHKRVECDFCLKEFIWPKYLQITNSLKNIHSVQIVSGEDIHLFDNIKTDIENTILVNWINDYYGQFQNDEDFVDSLKVNESNDLS